MANLQHTTMLLAGPSGWATYRAEQRHDDPDWMADLSRANLSRTNLSGADLSLADMSGANLCGADLSETVLAGTVLEAAVSDAATTWPHGFDPHAAGVSFRAATA